ncbi:MAG: hypothetical protein JNJ44_08370 [Zoogloeaceae bacterium]|nr:hypothetical protein [Zoogloeaceae bacterium]
MKRGFGGWQAAGVGVAMMVLGGSTGWAQVLNDWTVSTPSTYGHMVAVDGANNALVVGSVPFSTILVAKYGPTGALIWQREFDNPGTREQGNWIAVDGSGNAIVVGRLVAGSSNDPAGLVVLKYDADGNLLWQDVLPGAFAYGHRVLADAEGHVYVLGRAWVSNAAGNTTHDLVTIRYSAAGVREWTRYFGASDTSVDSPAAMALTPAGNVIVTGGAVGSLLFAAYDSVGNPLWTKAVPGVTAALDVQVAQNGDFYAVGGSATSGGATQMLVIKHDAQFNELWRKNYPQARYGQRLAIDGLGNPVVAGMINPGGGYFNWVTTKLDPAGNVLWSRGYDLHAYNDEIPSAISIGADNAIYVTGQGGPGPASGNLSYLRQVTVKYRADGTQDWANATFSSVRGVGVALGSDNGVYVVGESPLRLTHFRQTGILDTMGAVYAQASPVSGPAPLAVNFTSQLVDLFSTSGAYYWTFGDGSTSAEANPVHRYGAGSFVATLNWYAGESVYSAAPIAISASQVVIAPTPTGLTLASSSVVGGRSTQGTVTVSANGGVVVQLASGNPALVKLPASVQIPAGATSASFKISTSRVRVTTQVPITASANGGSVAATLTLTR